MCVINTTAFPSNVEYQGKICFLTIYIEMVLIDGFIIVFARRMKKDTRLDQIQDYCLCTHLRTGVYCFFLLNMKYFLITNDGDKSQLFIEYNRNYKQTKMLYFFVKNVIVARQR